MTGGRDERPELWAFTKLVPFGAFVQLAEGIEGLVRDLHGGLVGDELVVAIDAIDRQRRRIELRVRPPDTP